MASYYSRKRARSANVSARFKKKTRRTYRGKKATKRQVRRRRLPVAFRRRSTFRSAQMNAAKVLSLVGENKYQGYNSKNASAAETLTPKPKHGGTQPMSYVYFNAGQAFNPVNQGIHWQEMDVYKYPQGDTKTTRDGDFLFIKGTSCTINIQMLGGANSGTAGAGVNQGLNTPVLFRFMVLKGNRKNNPLGITPSCLKELFLDNENARFGTDDSARSPFEYMNAPLNKRQWNVIKDTKFILEPPAVDFNDQSTASSIQTATGKHPSHKNFKMFLPCNKKVHFDANDEPDNFDTQTMFILQAVSTGFNLATSSNPGLISLPRNYAVNVLATTTALDS